MSALIAPSVSRAATSATACFRQSPCSSKASKLWHKPSALVPTHNGCKAGGSGAAVRASDCPARVICLPRLEPDWDRITNNFGRAKFVHQPQRPTHELGSHHALRVPASAVLLRRSASLVTRRVSEAPDGRRRSRPRTLHEPHYTTSTVVTRYPSSTRGHLIDHAMSPRAGSLIASEMRRIL